MNELLTFIVKHLVANPDAVRVSERESEDGTLVLELHVAPDDMGRIIGRGGRLIKDIRNVVRAADRDGRRVNVDIVEQ